MLLSVYIGRGKGMDAGREVDGQETLVSSFVQGLVYK